MSHSLYGLQAPTRPYAWGSASAIPALLGFPVTGERQAEMWFGAHPSAPAVVDVDGHPQRLDEFVAAHPDLGGGKPLPFLMKLLAADTPLSLQVHPDLEQARAGFAREEASGRAPGDPTRSFTDANHKPEILVAITPFEALCGFAAPDESRAVLTDLLGREAERGTAAALLDALALPSTGQALRAALEVILSADGALDQATRAVVDAARAGIGGAGAATVRRIADAYGADPGILVALLLHRVDLAPGEAVFLGAGRLHAYLSGLGLEAMAASDNVLRGGLTSKHVDVPGLLEVVSFTPEAPARVVPVVSTSGGVTVHTYVAPVPEFVVHRIDAQAGRRVLSDLRGPATVVVVEGSLTFEAGTDVRRVGRGGALFQAAGATLTVAGSGRAYLTSGGGIHA